MLLCLITQYKTFNRLAKENMIALLEYLYLRITRISFTEVDVKDPSTTRRLQSHRASSLLH